MISIRKNTNSATPLIVAPYVYQAAFWRPLPNAHSSAAKN